VFSCPRRYSSVPTTPDLFILSRRLSRGWTLINALQGIQPSRTSIQFLDPPFPFLFSKEIICIAEVLNTCYYPTSCCATLEICVTPISLGFSSRALVVWIKPVKLMPPFRPCLISVSHHANPFLPLGTYTLSAITSRRYRTTDPVSPYTVLRSTCP